MNASDDLLVRSTERLFREQCTTAVVRESDGGGWPTELWTAVANAGLPWIAVPEGAGGSGGTVTDAFNVVRVAAASAAPIPLVETGLLGGWLLAASGLNIPQDAVSVGIGHPDDIVSLDRSPTGWRVSGSLHRVPFARHAARIVFLAEYEGQWHVVSLDRSRCWISERLNIAGEPRDDVSMNVEVQPEEIGAAPDGIDHSALALRGALARSVQIAGSLETIRDLTVGYAAERKQFGQALSRFQAVQQMLVEIAEETSMARVAVELAVSAVDTRGSAREVMIAKVVTDRAATIVAARAHQVHGAIGVTKEHNLQLFTRRVWSWRSEFGNGAHWAQQLGRAVVAEGVDRLWPSIASQ